MEKRVTFNGRWLPYLLVAPQIIVTVVFFFWPSGEMVWQSVLLEDAFGGNSKFVWFDNFVHLFNDPSYFASARLTLVFSFLVTSIGLAVSLLLAVMADRVIRGAESYRTFLVWPYAVAPAVAGVLWGFLFSPSVGVVVWLLRGVGIDFNYVIDGNQALLLIVFVWGAVGILRAAWRLLHSPGTAIGKALAAVAIAVVVLAVVFTGSDVAMLVDILTK